jgi:hypothetical protein
MMWNRVYATPAHGKDLAVDSKTWNLKIDDSAYAQDLARLHIDTQELHRRLARHWEILAELNAKGAHDIDQALNVGPRPSSTPGLEFLKISFLVDQPLLEALADFHRGMRLDYGAPTNKAGREDLQKALREAKQAEDLAVKAFPHPIDPVGNQLYNPSEVQAMRTFSKLLVQSIDQQLQ